MMFSLLLFSAVVSRLIPHAANFVAVGGLTIFASKKMSAVWATILAIAAMAIADIYLGFHGISWFVYLGLLGYVLAGRLIKSKISYVYTPVLGSVFFFIVSNLGVWLEGWYPMTFSGLVTCYVNALPFFRNTILSDLSFALGAFAIYAIYLKIKGGVLWLPSSLKPILKKR